MININTQDMRNANNHDERIVKMPFASVYQHYLIKVEKKCRKKEELYQVIECLRIGLKKRRTKKGIQNLLLAYYIIN